MPPASPSPPPTSGSVNRRVKSFRDRYSTLPPKIKAAAVNAFILFVKNPAHPSLRWHRLKDNDKGSHKDGSVSVSITIQYRAIYYTDGDRNIWYWVGTHAEYDKFTGA